MNKELILRISKKILPGILRRWMITQFVSLVHLIKYGDWNFPHAIWIETTTHCNRSCWYCPNSKMPIPEKTISIPAFERILLTLQEINWTGPVGYHYLSEPLLHPEIVKLVWMTKQMLPRSLPIIFSNGDYLTPELAALLVKAGLAKCSITAHKPIDAGWRARMKQVCAVSPIFEVFEIAPGQLMNMGGLVPVKNPQLKTCMSPLRVLPIRMNGELDLCCCDPQMKHTFGSAFNGIHSQWANPNWMLIRDRLMKGERLLSICKACTGCQ